MKLKSLLTCMMSLLLMTLNVGNLPAQTHKTTTPASKTTTAKKSTTSAARKANISGTKYIGMGTFQGKPIDLWIEISFADAEASMSMAGAYSFNGKYTATTTGSTMKVSIPFNEKIKATLSSTDKGGSMTGTLSLNGNPVKMWMVKIPSELTESNLEGDELENIFGSLDGYTALVKIRQGDGLLCLPADFTTDSSSKTWKMQFDNKAIQNIFDTAQGQYSASGNTIKLTDSNEMVRILKVYDDGKYLEAPMGSAQGLDLTLILIR